MDAELFLNPESARQLANEAQEVFNKTVESIQDLSQNSTIIQESADKSVTVHVRAMQVTKIILKDSARKLSTDKLIETIRVTINAALLSASKPSTTLSDTYDNLAEVAVGLDDFIPGFNDMFQAMRSTTKRVIEQQQEQLTAAQNKMSQEFGRSDFITSPEEQEYENRPYISYESDEFLSENFIEEDPHLDAKHPSAQPPERTRHSQENAIPPMRKKDWFS